MAISAPSGAAAVLSGKSGAGARWARACTSDCAAKRTFSRSVAPNASSPPAISVPGLATKSTAPSSSASMVSDAPLVVRVETITTGSGRSRMIFCKKASPFILGISISSVTTSGLSALILSRASSGSCAVPTTVISPSCASVLESTSRMSAESSTTRTLILLMLHPLRRHLPCVDRQSCRPV